MYRFSNLISIEVFILFAMKHGKQQKSYVVFQVHDLN